MSAAKDILNILHQSANAQQSNIFIAGSNIFEMNHGSILILENVFDQTESQSGLGGLWWYVADCTTFL